MMKKIIILLFMLTTVLSTVAQRRPVTSRADRTLHPRHTPHSGSYRSTEVKKTSETGEKKFETQTARTGQSIWGIVKDHQKKYPWYNRKMFLEDNPEIARRKPYIKLDPCDSTKVLYSTPPIHPGDTYRLRLDEGGPVNPPNGSSAWSR